MRAGEFRRARFERAVRLRLALAVLAVPAALAAQEPDSLTRPGAGARDSLAQPGVRDSLPFAPAGDSLAQPAGRDSLGRPGRTGADSLAVPSDTLDVYLRAPALRGDAAAGAVVPPGTPESGPPVPLSLAQAEALALERNERVLLAREDIERTRGLVREVRAASLPTLDVNYNYVRNIQQPVIFFNQGGEVQQITVGSSNDNTIGISVEQTLFSRSVNAANRGAAIAQQVSRLGLEDVAEALIVDVRRAYYGALLNAALILVQEQALAQADARLRQVEQFFEVGTASEFDQLTAQVESDNIRPLLIEARNDYVLALNELKRLVGLPLERPVELTDALRYEPVDLTLEEARELAGVQRDDLRRQRANVQLQQQAVAVERAASFPELSFTFDLARRASSDEFVPSSFEFSQSAAAGLEISMPIFDGRATEGRVRQARADLASEELRLRALEQDVALEVQQALQNVAASSERIAAAEATVGRAQRALEIAQTRFRNGLSTQLELNDAELALTEARTTLVRGLYDYNVARAELLRAVGER